MKTADPEPKEDDETPKKSEPLIEVRDAGVSEADWQQLQKDKRETEVQNQQAVQRIQEQEEAHLLAIEAEKEAEIEAAALREIQAKNEAKALELLRLREEARIRETEASAKRELIRRELERRKQEEEKRRKKGERAQTKLRQMGVCVAGYRWIKQGGGYRCADGSHWVDDSRLGI